jgi:sugar lactone lactonase YvrE
MVEGDAYLNDVNVGPDGSVYVTDSRYSKIYHLNEGGLEVWLEHESVQMPNGIHVIGDELYIAAGDTTVENPGASRYLQAVSLADKSVHPLRDREPAGALDAVEPDGKGGLFVTGWASGRLMHFTPETGLTLLEQLGQGAADVDYIAADRMLYVPVMQEGQLIAYEVTFN